MNAIVQSLRCGPVSVAVREGDRAVSEQLLKQLSLLRGRRERGASAGGALEDAATLDLGPDPRPLLILGPSVDLGALEVCLLAAPARAVLVLCNQGDLGRRSEALRLGADEAAPWPLSVDDLGLSLELAVERRRRADDLTIVQRDLAALLELSESLVDTHDVSSTLLEICQRVAEVMQADRCSIVLLDDEATHGFVVASSDDSSMQNHRIDVAKYPEIREVVRTGAPLVIDDIGHAPLFDSVREELRGKPVGSTTIIPVRMDRRVQGVLMLRERLVRARGLSEREIRFGRIVANATAISIRNARLYEMVRDTSERRLSERLKAERRLRQIEKYQRFFDYAGDGLIIVDGASRVLFANRAARSILGFEAAALARLTLHDLVEPAGRPSLDRVMDGVRRGVPSSLDLPVTLASGRAATLSLTAASLDDAREPDGSEEPEAAAGDAPAAAEAPGGDEPGAARRAPAVRAGSQPGRSDVTAIISFRDVTEMRAMQEELRRTKDFLLNLIESSADAIVAADMDGRIIIFNNVAERITGHAASAAVGSNVEMLYPPGVAREIMADLRSGSGKIQDRRQQLSTASGELVPINLAVSIVHDGGRAVATVGIFSDLRAQLRMEAALQQAQRQLELSERQAAIVELAGAAAHELNQPLTSVIGSAELIERKLPPDSPAHGSLRLLLSEAERMAEIVRKLGQITKYETKPYVGVTHIVDLDAASKEWK